MGHFHWFSGGLETKGSQGLLTKNLRARDNSFSA